MFTGIIEKTGRIVKREKNAVFVESLPGVEEGESVAVNGVCLTVSSVEGVVAKFDVSARTMEITNLGFSDIVNIERALKAGDRVSGHFITGHIDGFVKIEEIEAFGDFKKFSFGFPEEFSKYIAPRGSVALDGISLTVESVSKSVFSVNVIPETLKRTNLAERKAGDFVNFEADVFARYIVNFLDKEKAGITKEKLEKWL